MWIQTLSSHACLVETSPHRLSHFTLRHCCFHQKVDVPESRAANCSSRTVGLWWRLLESRGGVKCSVAVCATGWVIPPTSLYSCCPEGRQRPGQLASTPSARANESPWNQDRDLHLFALLFPSFSFVSVDLFGNTFFWPSTQLQHSTEDKENLHILASVYISIFFFPASRRLAVFVLWN